MAKFDPTYKYALDEEHGIFVQLVNASLDGFSPRLLSLGDLKTPSKPVDVLAVLFDLEGFTTFTRQVDPQLTVPSFVSDFLDWLFDTIKGELAFDAKQQLLWAELPFFSKFMGDGVLFLWKLDLDRIVGIDPNQPADKIRSQIQEFLTNIVASLLEVCDKYDLFLKRARTQHVDPPTRLRCGMARGTVIPIGRGTDFVGPCINIAARLQKFNDLSFAFSARGIDASGFGPDYRDKFVKKRVSIRGIGDNELIYVPKEEVAKLPADVQALFRDP